MKKTIIILAAAIIGLSSCGGDSGLKSMINEGTKLDCEKAELRKKMDAGDTTVSARYDKVKKELNDLGDKLREKYKDKEKDKDFLEKVGKYSIEAKAKYCPEKK